MEWDYLCGAGPQTRPFSVPQMIHEWLDMECTHGFWQPIPVPLYPPQIPYWLSWARTRASAARSRRLTARAMAWPCRAMLIKTRTKFGMKFRWTNRLLLLPPTPRLWVSGRLQHAYFILISLVYLQCKKILPPLPLSIEIKVFELLGLRTGLYNGNKCHKSWVSLAWPYASSSRYDTLFLWNSI
jgi:hypothetical protein